MTQTDNNRGLQRLQMFSGAQLKYIAFTSMLIDHVNKALLYPYLNNDFLMHLSNLFDILGRIAFPLFAFLLVEGFFHTHNRWKYLGTLLLFGVISEVPFDMFTTKEFVNFRWNNVMFTLAFMLVTIWLVDALREKLENKTEGEEKRVGNELNGRTVLWYALSLLIVAGMCLAAMMASLDYDYHGILIAYFFYLLQRRPLLRILCGYLSMVKEVWSLLGFGLTLTYNGERGRQNKLLNYLFYPVHLLILGLLRFYLGV